mmetsp:Transcript_15070/g.23750  ORF Transcript_15070/g.23750 Transcript_15070/m.23750 type:complete len:234 (+) Transcript_15070:558-1259(+)
MLDKRTEGIAVGGDDDVLAGLEFGNDVVFVVGGDAFEGGFEGFRPFVGEVESGIPRIIPRMMLTRSIHRRGRDIVTPPPNQHLILSMLIHRLLLIQPLQRPVMTFVQLPRLGHGDPHEVRLLEDVPESPDGAFLERGEGNVGDDAGILDEFARLDDFLVSLGREGDVDPSGEFVFEIPGGFSVTDEDEGVFVGGLEGREVSCIGCNSCTMAGANGKGVTSSGKHGEGNVSLSL